MMSERMSIGQEELAELLTDEIFRATAIDDEGHVFDDCICIEYGFTIVYLQHVKWQEYYIVESDGNDMFPGSTISVDEILDIVL